MDTFFQNFSLQILCSFLLITVTAAQDGWQDPPLKDIGNPNVVPKLENDQWVIQISEELNDLNKNGLQLMYQGTSKLTITGAGDYVFDIQRTATNEYYLIVKKSPDFEQARFLTTITISDDKMKSITAVLNLQNIDDNAPQARLLNPTCKIKENSLKTEEACVITVTDADGCAGIIDYQINAEDADGLFAIALQNEKPEIYPNCLNDAATQKTANYTLQVKKELDYEMVRSYFLEIGYNDQKPNTGLTSLQWVVEVLDVADLPPAWVTILTAQTVNEEEEKSITVKAKDQDVGINAEICYSLKITDSDLTEDEKQCFGIDEKTGVITIGKIYRDDWQRNSYTLILNAAECLDPQSFVTGTLVIQVLDSINKMFTYTINGVEDNKFPIVTFPENKVISFPNNVLVTDPDESDAGTFTASLDNDKFMVLPERGLKSATFVIQGMTPLDYEKDEAEFEITLTIQEVKDSSHKVDIPIAISVTNVNDNAPVFSNVDEGDKALHLTVPENQEIGKLLNIQATDADGDEITYGMVASTGLEIDGKTGDFSLTKRVFDYEQQKTIVIQITAADDTFTTYVPLKIDIQDINDTPPTIRVQAQGTPTIAEDAKIGDEVKIEITASDDDTTAELEAFIDWETTTGTKINQQIDKSKFIGWFDVKFDKPSGKITILVADELKWDVIDTIQLKITVNDTETVENESSYQTSVSIIIQDVNNHAPDFGDSCGVKQPELEMQENAREGLVFGTIIAIDADGPGNNKVIYSLEDAEEKRVKIDPDTGLISTGSQSVDYEVDQSITVGIVATDDTPEKLFSSCQIIIGIIDVNDEIPVGKAEPENIAIPEDTANQFFISHVTGTDNDISPSFSNITYSMNSMNTIKVQDYFTLIETDDGVDIVVQFKNDETHFDFEGDDKKYDISIVLTDYPDDPTGGRLQKSSSVPVSISITDINDNNPKLNAPSEQNCFFSVSELTLADIPLTGDDKLVATDADSGINSWISYSIIQVECLMETMKICTDDKDKLFKVSGNTETEQQNVKADIRSQIPLENKYGEYLVTVIATDHGKPALESEPKNYKFCIIDENNNSPVINYPSTITIHQDRATGSLIDDSTGEELAFISASDDDFAENSQISWSLEPNDVFSLIAQGTYQSKIVLNAGIDLSNAGDTRVKIRACDSPKTGSPNCPEKDLQIKVRFIDEVEPEYEQNSVDYLITESDSNASVDLPKAIDRNNDDTNTQNIYYFIIKSEPEDSLDYFQLGDLENKLTLKKALDAYITDNYILTIQTTNSPKPPSPSPADKSLLSVNITVEDINDKFPIFDRSEYIISMSSGDEGRNLFTLNAIDPDRHDTVSYLIDKNSIDASHLDVVIDTVDMFSIEEATGAVKIVKYPTTATRGYVSFTASASDGLHKTDVAVSVYVVSKEYLIPVRFQNSASELALHVEDVVAKLSTTFSHKCISGSSSSDSVYSTLLVHFEDDEMKPVEPDKLLTVINNATAMNALILEFKDEYGLSLVQFGYDSVIQNTPEEINTALIVTSAVLGGLLIISIIFFFVKLRSFKQHLDRITKASAETHLETKGTVLPNTNQNIGVGSNPLYNVEMEHQLDNISTTSSTHSDLVGIEDDPEFQTFYNQIVNEAASRGQNTDDMLRENPQLRGLDFGDTNDLNY